MKLFTRHHGLKGPTDKGYELAPQQFVDDRPLGRRTQTFCSGHGLSARFRTPPLYTLQYELIDHLLFAGAQSGRLPCALGRLQQTDLGRHFEGREGRLLVAFQRALDLLQYDPFKLADRPLSRALAQDHGGGERALDDGLEVPAIPRAPARVSRFPRLEA